MAAGVAPTAGVGVTLAAALVFLECFLVGEAEASGVGLGVGSAARTKGAAAKALMIIRVIRKRMGGFLKVVPHVWQGFHVLCIKPAINQARGKRLAIRKQLIAINIAPLAMAPAIN